MPPIIEPKAPVTKAPPSRVSRLLAKLEQVRPAGPAKWTACCPAHDDHNPSFSVSATLDGRILMKCFAGCEYDEIVKSLGFAPDFFAPDVGQSLRIA